MGRLLHLPIAILAATVAIATTVHAAPTKTKKSKLQRASKTRQEPRQGPLPWCAEETETLPNGLCYIDGGQKDARRTLVIFLHGAIAKDVDWQWLQERALLRQAKQNKFEAVFARAPLSSGGYVWSGIGAGQEEEQLIEQWNAARAFLEKRNEKPYDDVFLMGFSSGAYYVSSLALRGRAKFDGYAVFAGGASFAKGTTDVRAPIYVGVCADDRQTANHSRAFGGTLSALGWPSRIDEQRVGHMFSDIHVAHAITYLRNARTH